MKGRDAFVVRLGRVLQALPLAWLRPLEKLSLSLIPAREPHIIFLIAPPRSGSTVCYQALVHSLQPMYLSNLWNLLYQLPLLGGLLSRLKCTGHASSFSSTRGFVEGLCGPAEGLRFWSYWFGHGLSDPGPAGRPPPEAGTAHVRAVLGCLSRPERPFVAGYIGHTLVVEELIRLFPAAVFVHLRRDLADNAMSILAIRRELPGGADFSVQPSEWNAHRGGGAHQEAAAQAWLLDRRVRLALDPARTIELRYEDLCANPAAEVGRVVEFCNARGFRLEMKAQLPERLGAGPRMAADSEDLRRIKEILGELDDAAQDRARSDV
ncbi:sulfotransferase [Luteimonas sp. 8-5]|uniref:sulfotransferase family protein n=1 Tax=Luteimonas sp. 8-5 TaxID=3039387 RepID=UPI002436E725|nr:sulfotransferase [Luteimonas sp. 8-5]MDG6348299.1 sulfotransferase [Luteimonas sp. 8-5]